MPQQVRENVFLDRMISVLSAAFAFLATLLAAVGLLRRARLHRVAAHARDRPADGARRRGPRVRHMVLKQVGWMTLIGAAAGVTGAYYLGRAAASLLFELEPCRSGGDREFRGRVGDRRAWRRVHSRLPRLARTPDAGAQVRVTGESIWLVISAARAIPSHLPSGRRRSSRQPLLSAS